MLTKFSVANFKGFNEEFVLDLKDTNSYEFNSGSIVNGVVNNALVYGYNGVGKSNLGFAIFDVISHVTDKFIDENGYRSHTYLNAVNASPTASFRYEFLFEDVEVSYRYEKTDLKSIISETLEVNGKILASLDRTQSDTAEINVAGAETLNRDISNKSLSLLKYIKNNTLFKNTAENRALVNFYDFVDSMLFFRCLNNNAFIGLESDSHGIQEDIIEQGHVPELEKFLRKAGIECKLKVVKELDQDRIAFDFDGKDISIYDIASTGTRSLILFYFWLQRLKKEDLVQFLFLDEFDAFYHHSLSAMIVEELKKTGIQFILTTHNTSIITNELLRPDCYFLMKKDSIRSLARSTTKELREAHNIEKMYKAGSFNV